MSAGENSLNTISGDENENDGITPEKKWTDEATNRLIDLICERKRNIIEAGTIDSMHIHRLRYEEWHVISKQLQAESLMYTTVSCQKKFNNMRRSYINNLKIIEKEKAERTKKGNISHPIIVLWPFFKRFAEFLDDVVDPLVSVKEFDDEDDEDGDSKKHSKLAKHRAEVSNAIHTIFKSEPVMILEDIQVNENKDYSLHLVPDSILPDQESDGGGILRDESLISRLRRRRERIDECTTSPSKRKRKSRVTFSPSQSPPHEVKFTPSSAPKRTFSLTSTPSEELLTEVKLLREEVGQTNHHLEELVNSHNRLSEKFEKFIKLMSKKKI